MSLSKLRPPKGAKHSKKRVGRGQGSGTGKTAGRGHKGAKSRSGFKHKRGFEGGQMPLHRRLPKRGFKNTAFQLDLSEVNLGRVQAAIDAGVVDAKDPVDVDTLVKAGVLSRARGGVKLLGGGEIKAKVDFTVWRASKSAIAAVEKAGGTVKILAPAKEAPAEPRGKNARFAAGLDKPKIVEAAPAATKGDKKKAADGDAKTEKKAEKPAKPAGKKPA
jgi:large subunit ribosomal protein L15